MLHEWGIQYTLLVSSRLFICFTLSCCLHSVGPAERLTRRDTTLSMTVLYHIFRLRNEAPTSYAFRKISFVVR